MAIPQNFQTIMLPLLQIVADGKNHNMNDVIDALANHFKLTEEEKNLQYPTGSDYIFKNKARFARLYLLKVGLLDYPQRGYVKISNDGLSVLAKKPQEVNLQLLEEFPKFNLKRGQGQLNLGICVIISRYATASSGISSRHCLSRD